ncbi:MAG: phenylalanine--tRNA ligase subunit beta [Clostridia bacterium]
MNVSLNWLKEYVPLDENIKIKEIIDRLTMSGTKVEKYEEFGKITQNVFTGKVLDIKPHAEDKNLKILTLNLGDKILTAVAKIPDIEVGNIIPVALPGAKVIGKDIEVSDVKKIKSECMVCHILDLGLDQTFPWVKPSGLLVFPNDVEVGKNVNDILGLGDYIIEFEITPNRVDCLSVEGIANELALTFNQPCKTLWHNIKPEFNTCDSVDNITVKIDTLSCKRYTMNVAQNVLVKDSNASIQLKLIKSGIRPINNIVDITNYVLLEIGQPLHAFDYEKLKSNNIIVRQARENEVIQTLDLQERILNNDNMVIANDSIPVAIAGIMGAEISSICRDTKTVVIESANFARASIRNTSRKLCLRTCASSNYEKGLPQELTAYAMNRVMNLINTTNSGVMKNDVVDIYPIKQDEVNILIDYEKINKIIGTNIDKNNICKMLKSVALTIENDIAYIPYFREDLKINEDLAEEIARIYGYDKLDSKLPDTSLTFGEKTILQKMEDKIKEITMANGYSEIYTYTFFSKDLLERMNVAKDDIRYNCIKITNPLSSEFEYMRTTAMPLMLEALERNYTKKNLNIKIFELGNVFLDVENIQNNELCREEKVLTLGMYDEKLDFYDFKEVIESILKYYNILSLDYEIDRIVDKCEYHPGVSAKITIDNDVIAEFGKMSTKLILNYILPENTYIATLYFDKLVKYAKTKTIFKELPKFPAVERDIAFTIDEDILSYNIEKELLKIDNIEQVRLFDVYQGTQIADGKKSMAYNLMLRLSNKTLEEKEIILIMNNVKEILANKFNAYIRS